jgi:hypothetical protein
MNIGMVVRSEAFFGEFKAKVVISPIITETTTHIIKHTIQHASWYTTRFIAKCIPYGGYEGDCIKDKKLFNIQGGLYLI